MNPTTLQSIWTIVALATFVGIVVWAWSRRAQPGFEEAARMPLEDDPEPIAAQRENDHG